MELDTSLERPDMRQQRVLAAVETVVTGIDHIAIAVADLAAACEWYTQSLGFKCIGRRMTQGERTSMISAVLVAGSSVLVLIQGIEPQSQVSRFVEKAGAGVQHVAFGVTDLDEAMRRVIAAGASADTEVIEDEGIRQVFLHREAGSGVRIELIEKRGGEFSARSIERLFRKFEADDLY